MRNIFKRKPKYSDEELFKAEGLNWLLKNADIKNPVLQEMLVQNIERSCPFLEHLEILVDYKNCKFMIFLRISSLGWLFLRKKSTCKKVVKLLQQGFPQYSVKIWFNQEEWDKHVKSLTN